MSAHTLYNDDSSQGIPRDPGSAEASQKTECCHA